MHTHTYIHTYIYIYIYIYIKHSFPIMVAHAITTAYIIVIVIVSCMQLLLCAIYQNQKGVWLVYFF